MGNKFFLAIFTIALLSQAHRVIPNFVKSSTSVSKLVLDRHRRRLKGEDLPNTYSYRLVNKSGEIKWSELKVVPFAWENGPAILCFETDITQRKQAEEKIKNLY